jgi:hypothetical protein
LPAALSRIAIVKKQQLACRLEAGLLAQLIRDTDVRVKKFSISFPNNICEKKK